VLQGTAAALALFVGLGTWLFVFPPVDPLEKTDVVFVLGGLNSEAVLAKALEVADAGYTDTIYISDSFGGDTRAANLCASASVYTIECFDPPIGTTQGEAEEIRRLTAEHGWSSVTVVTLEYHVTRSRFVVGRCFSGDLVVVGADADIDLGAWAYQYFYQTGAFVKALLTPDC
jgi:uncharacterized SAM-binding protein YcdF (DUF218 family)